jgi:hypothetical protein
MRDEGIRRRQDSSLILHPSSFGGRRPHGLFFVSDGMRQDLIERYAAEGAMPAMAAMLRNGVHGANGALPPVPTNTSPGWATLATGAWSGRTGAINNVLHMPGDPVHIGRQGFGADLVEVETLAQAAERQGLTTLTFEWASAMPATCAGPVVSYWQFFAARGIVTTFVPEGMRYDAAAGRGLFCTLATFHPAADWLGLDDRATTPASRLPPRACSFVLPTQDANVNPDRMLHILVCASGSAGYDRVMVCEAKDATRPLAALTPGAWAPARLALPDGRIAGFWLKCLDLTPDLSRFRLYVTTLARSQASPPALEDRLATWDLPPLVAADYGPFQARLIDEQTYVEQGLLWFDVAHSALARLVDEVRPDLLLVGAPVTDEFSHQFMAMTTPAYHGYGPALAAHYDGLIRLAYRKTDEFLAHARALMPPDTVTLVSSDHGFGAAWRAVNANLVLHHAGLLHYDEAGRPTAASRAVSYATGATANIYLSVCGRDPGGTVDPAEYGREQERVIQAFRGLRDPAAPHGALVARALRREELAAIETSAGPANMRHPTRSGDVVVILAPPYQFDGASPHELIADAPMLGQHGYLPDVVDAEANVNMRSAFLMDGPGVRAGHCIRGARAIDLAPTLACALGIAGPSDADGQVLEEAFGEAPRSAAI